MNDYIPNTYEENSFIFKTVLIWCSIICTEKIRQPIDSVGFADKSSRTDFFVKRIDKIYGSGIDSSDTRNKLNKNTDFRLAICPHDGYTYTGFMYAGVLPYIKAKTVIIFGVVLTAKKFHVEQNRFFDSFDEWKAPYGNKKKLSLREAIKGKTAIANLHHWVSYATFGYK